MLSPCMGTWDLVFTGRAGPAPGQWAGPHMAVSLVKDKQSPPITDCLFPCEQKGDRDQPLPPAPHPRKKK